MKDAVVRARIESNIKATVEKIFDKLGLSPSEAITLFYYQVALRKGLPFQVEIPNEETIATFEATDRGEGLVFCENAEDMFKRLEI